MMSRFYLSLALLPILLLTAVLLVIRAQPYDDRVLRGFLNPDGCPKPCFLGITPGTTTVNQAVAILETNEWINHYEYLPDLRLITLGWSTQSPVWLRDAGRRGASIWITNDVVENINIDTQLTLNHLVLSFGEPEINHINLNYVEAGSYLLYTGSYTRFGITAITQGNCDGTRKNITYYDYLYLDYRNPKNTLNAYTQPSDTWADIRLTTCPSYS